MEETKIIYYIEDDKVPYLIKLNISSEKATLKDFKNALNQPYKNLKFFFQTIVDDFGVVKEELIDDDAKMPSVNGRIVSWLIPIDGSVVSGGNVDTRSQNSLNSIDAIVAQSSKHSKHSNQDDKPLIKNQFVSMQSIASTASSMSNNENMDSNNRHMRHQQQICSSKNVTNSQNKASTTSSLNHQNQIYDSLNNINRRSIKNRQLTIKDLNADNASTDTESLINAFDDLRVMQQRANALVSSSSSSNRNIKKGSKPHLNSFNPNDKMNPLHKQKLSLDSKYNHYYHNDHQQQQQQQHHALNKLNKPSNSNHLKKKDSLNDNEDDDNIQNIQNDYDSTANNTNLIDETKEGVRKMSNGGGVGGVGGCVPSILSSDIESTTFFDTENDEEDDDDDDYDDDDGQFSSITAETTSSTIASSTNNRKSNRNRRQQKVRSHHYHHNNNHHLHTQNHHNRHLHHQNNHHLRAHNSLHSSMTSLTDSTMSLNIITVTLNMDTVNFLGISIVGQSNKGGEGGIYVGSIMSGGAVAQDGRIEPGDMILQVNDVSFENMSNDDAVKVLREAVMKPGPVKLVVAKCWDPNPKGYFTVSKQEPVRPIDPSAWVAHTQAHTALNQMPTNAGGSSNYGIYQNNGLKSTSHHNNYKLTHSISSFGSNTSLTTSIADSTLSTTYNNAIGGATEAANANYHMQATTTTMNGGDSTRFGNEQLNLTVNTDMETVVRAMSVSDSGLDVRDRNWLKITIKNAFIGSDIVDWLFNHVEGFPDRRDARKYACNMLRYGFICHAVNKIRFSEQCYYIFGDFNQSTLNSQMFSNLVTATTSNGPNANLFTLNEESEADFDSVSEMDRDTLYAPMNFPLPGSYNNNYQLTTNKIYSNGAIGIGGPPPPPSLSYMSSSSSNATSNSTSTTSNNTTSQTIATNTTALGGNCGATNNVSFNSTTNQSQQHQYQQQKYQKNSYITANGGLLNTDRSNACQFYYPAPSVQLTSFNNNNNTTNTTSSSFYNHQQQQQQPNKQNLFYDSQNETAQSQFTINDNNTTINNTDITTNSGIINQPPPANSIISHFNYQNQTKNIYQNSSNVYNNINNSSINSNYSKHENKSVKSSDNSSSGNGSDVELLSSSKSKNQSNNKKNRISISQSKPSQQQTSSSSNSQQQQQQQSRTLDKVPSELRLSKQSFHAAMGNPCEFFVDVM